MTTPYETGKYLLGDADKLPRVWFDAARIGSRIKIHAQVEFEATIREFDSRIVPAGHAVTAAAELVLDAFDYLSVEVQLELPAVVASAHPFVLFVESLT